MAAPKPKDLQHEEAALRKRLDFVSELKQSLAQAEGLPAQAVGAYTGIIDGVGCLGGVTWNDMLLHVRLLSVCPVGGPCTHDAQQTFCCACETQS